MKNTIEGLYYGTINDGAENARFLCEESEENRVYEALRGTLTEEQQTLLERYEELCCTRQNGALEQTYKKGFQRGASLMMEILKK